MRNFRINLPGVLFVTVAISVAVVYASTAGDSPDDAIATTMQSSIPTTSMPLVMIGGPECPEDPDGEGSVCPDLELLVYAQSPLYLCAATMHDIDLGVVIDAYNIRRGQLIDDGVVISEPYLVEIYDGISEYVIDIQVGDLTDRWFLSSLGLLPSAPGGVWSGANFTVLAGADCLEPLP